MIMTRWIAAFSLAITATLGAAPEAAAQTKLRVATLAPKNSAWGKVYKVWGKAIEQKSDGKLQADIFYNAVQGDEAAMVTHYHDGRADARMVVRDRLWQRGRQGRLARNIVRCPERCSETGQSSASHAAICRPVGLRQRRSVR